MSPPERQQAAFDGVLRCRASGTLRRLCEAMALTVASVFLMRWWSLFQDQLLQLVGRLALFGVDAGLGEQRPPADDPPLD
jgi:hypothetical protein